MILGFFTAHNECSSSEFGPRHNDPQLVGCGSLRKLAAATFLFYRLTRYPHTDTDAHAHGHGADARPDVGSRNHAWFSSIWIGLQMSRKRAKTQATSAMLSGRCVWLVQPDRAWLNLCLTCSCDDGDQFSCNLFSTYKPRGTSVHDFRKSELGKRWGTDGVCRRLFDITCPCEPVVRQCQHGSG